MVTVVVVVAMIMIMIHNHARKVIFILVHLDRHIYEIALYDLYCNTSVIVVKITTH
jgi:hypothetical protein